MQRLMLCWLMRLSLLLPLTADAQTEDADSCCRLRPGPLTTEQLGREFRRLRSEREDACCRRYGSGLMEVMHRLGDSLRSGMSARTVRRIMGQPDAVSGTGYGTVRPARGEKLLAYHWRGRHDFLCLFIRKGRLVRSSWYHAWE